MAKKELTFKGIEINNVKTLEWNKFLEIIDARPRRTLKRGLKEQHKILREHLKLAREGKKVKPVKTHVRDMIILPEMIGQTVHVYNGKTFVPVIINYEMIGNYLGDYVMTRVKTKHSAPGVGATKSSAAKKK